MKRKFKRCRKPSCRHKNFDLSLFQCEVCGEDIYNLSVEEEEEKKVVAEPSELQNEPDLAGSMKKCPHCGHEYRANQHLWECENCRKDLESKARPISVGLVAGDPEEEQAIDSAPEVTGGLGEHRHRQQPSQEGSETISGPNSVPLSDTASALRPDSGSGSVTLRVCSKCGTVNPFSIRKCHCGHDIANDPNTVTRVVPAHAIPTPGQAPSEPRAQIFELCSDTGIVFRLLGEETIIGRGYELGQLTGYLQDKLYVGKRQVRLVIREESLFIQHLTGRNPTFVGSRSLVPGEEYPLQSGEQIGLGGAVQNGPKQQKAAYLTVRKS